MTNRKEQTMMESQEAFEAATRDGDRFLLPLTSRSYHRFRQNYLVPVISIYKELVVDPQRMELQQRTPTTIFSRPFPEYCGELERIAAWDPGLERLEDLLGKVEGTDLDYLIDEAWLAFDGELGKIQMAIIQQFGEDTDGALETIDHLLAQPLNYARAECLLYCYRKMAERIKEVKGWSVQK